MNYYQFNIIISCIGYSKQLEACLWYWNNSSYPKNKFNIIISTIRKDIETLRIIKKYDVNYILLDKNIHNKGLAISNSINLLKSLKVEDSSYLMLSDADMIFPDNTLNCLNLFLIEHDNCVVSSRREDIDELDIPMFFSEYPKNKKDWVWQNLKRKIISPSPFMGWFLSYPYNISNKIDYNINHQGYDCIDWKIYGQLKTMGLKEDLLYLDNVPLHLYHGEKGKNWKGIDIK